jgi:phenylacetate-coenzyme A ligase PaaK-like adenylate-forming protein
VVAAARRLPGYRPYADQPFERWPILEKERARARPQDYLAPVWPFRRGATGGTSGVPFVVERSVGSIVFEQASLDHICALNGVEPRRARVAVLRADFIKPPADRSPPFWRQVAERRLLLSSFHLSPEVVNAYADALAAFRPHLLMCYPSSLAHLTALLAAAGRRLDIPLVLASSEVLRGETIAQARALLSARVIDYYGQAERVAAAYGVDGEPLRLAPLYACVETLDQEGGGLAGASLWNRRQLLLRYAMSDRIVLEPGSPPGRLDASARFRIEGRTQERLDLPDGRSVIGLNHIPRGVRGLACLQIRRTGPWRAEVIVTRAPGFDAASQDQIARNLALKFPPDMQFDMRFVETPERSPSGKAPLLLA